MIFFSIHSINKTNLLVSHQSYLRGQKKLITREFWVENQNNFRTIANVLRICTQLDKLHQNSKTNAGHFLRIFHLYLMLSGSLPPLPPLSPHRGHFRFWPFVRISRENFKGQLCTRLNSNGQRRKQI